MSVRLAVAIPVTIFVAALLKKAWDGDAAPSGRELLALALGSVIVGLVLCGLYALWIWALA